MERHRRILVIGAGASGLTAIKSCKEESLDVVCYEKTKIFGGRWRFNEKCIPKTASIMKSTVCISSKEMEAFSDFPPTKKFPNFLHNTKMLDYLSLYAENFDLIRHIIYHREVVKVVPSLEYDKNGKWLVSSINKSDNSETTEEFSGVMICTGRLCDPVLPYFKNQNLFTGTILHSQNLKTPKNFEDLKVLVIGSGNSAIDVAVEISTLAHQVYLSSKNGFWVFPKIGPKGLPYDMFILRRDIHWLKNMCKNIVNKYIERYLESKLNHDAYGIKPSFRALDKIPSVNDDLADKILTGRILIKGNVSRFEEKGVIFEHEENLTELDSVVYATGYSLNLPFIEEVNDIKVSSTLYKWVFPVRMKHPSLAFIGFVRNNGPQLPVAESQCRWSVRVFSKKLNLPSKESMEEYISSNSSNKGKNGKINVDYIEYMDELCEEYGAKPNMRSLLFKDFQLFWALFSGPFLSYQFRLQGPNKLENARDLILTYEERVKETFNAKRSKKISN